MKTENLTFLEAIEAMKRGECADYMSCVGDCPFSIKDGHLRAYLGKRWVRSDSMNTIDLYKIVPDPSKPKQKESERLWQEYLSKVRRLHGEKPLVWERDTVDIHCNLIDYILARVKEERE